MAIHALPRHFAYFFGRLNAGPSFERQAASEHAALRILIESPHGPAHELSPRCFLQGSYKQQTAIYSINDVDLVVLCKLWHPGSGSGSGWSRDQIFDTIAAAILRDWRYRDKIRYGNTSMCIKVDLGIKVEILPVVFKAGNYDPAVEPFRLYRPENAQWEDGFARYHQRLLSQKNARCNGNFIPAIKVFKHLRSEYSTGSVSFHIECLLYSLPDHLFKGNPAEYLVAVLGHIAITGAEQWYGKAIMTPCNDRDIFVSTEWEKSNWMQFHKLVLLWHRGASLANSSTEPDKAIECWQIVLGEGFFPSKVSS